MDNQYLNRASLLHSDVRCAPRALIRQRSGLCLDLFAPDPNAWTDEDAALGLSRTFRWGGHTAISPWPLSVAQHSLTVLALELSAATQPWTKKEILRSLVHDLDESLFCGFDAITPLKPFLGPGFTEISSRLTAAIAHRYGLAERTSAEYQQHKRADILAAATEAVFVVGWKPVEVSDVLGIGVTPLTYDPLVEIYGCVPWEPWPSPVAADRFYAELTGVPDSAFARWISKRFQSSAC